MANIDPYSLAASRLGMFFNDTALGTATGFFWEHADRIFLVTNWHVVSGKHPQTGKHLADHAGEPNRMRIYIPRAEVKGSGQPVEIILRDEDGRPIWLVHPQFGNQVDVVAIEISPPGIDEPIHPINTLPTVPPEVKTSIASDVYVLGFPLGIRSELPIWKRASVATEPELGGLDQPMLIDTATREGMSGAPVIWRGDSYLLERGNERQRVMGGTHSKFIGIYSSRSAAKDAMEAQLGHVWRAAVIEEIIGGGVRDN